MAGLLDGLKKAVAERALNAEIDHHLETGAADGRKEILGLWIEQSEGAKVWYE